MFGFYGRRLAFYPRKNALNKLICPEVKFEPQTRVFIKIMHRTIRGLDASLIESAAVTEYQVTWNAVSGAANYKIKIVRGVAEVGGGDKAASTGSHKFGHKLNRTP